MQYSKEFIKAIPKTDLHVHLDGSLRLGTLIELAQAQKIELPSYTEEGLNELVFKPNYANLDEYLKGFGLTCSVMQNAEALRRIARELALDNFAEGVRYLEVRFAPQLHVSDSLSFEEVMGAVDDGLVDARKEINENLPSGEPRFEYGIIVCAMRFFNEHFSEYYRAFVKALPYSDPVNVMRLASLELAYAAVKLRKESEIQLVGFDLAGSEYGYPASVHEESYQEIHRNFMNKTVHAGEAYGPESIFQAITDLHADRIGHGLHLFNPEMIFNDEIADKNKYISELANFLANQRTTIEVCLTSNMQTSPFFKSVREHSLGKMLANNLSLTFCTDNRLVSHTTVCREIGLAVDNFDLSPKQLKNIIIYGFKRSFFYKPYTEKRNYVRSIINYYEALEKKYGVV